MAMKTAYFDGAQMKGFNVPDPWHSDVGWEPATNPTDAELYGRVAALYAAMNLSADALSHLPFAIVNGKKDFDVSHDWKNKVGFMPRPVDLLRLWRLSLFATNAAYGFMEYNKGAKNLRYIVPTTITPELKTKKTEEDQSPDGSLKSLWRNTGMSRTEWPVGPISPKFPIFYMWHLDHTTELLPSEYSEMYACMSAAGILRWGDYFVEEFFKRGGIVPHILLVKGVPSEPAQQRIEAAFQKLITMTYKTIGKIFNAEAFDVKQLGVGIETLKDSSLSDKAIANIAMAARMPLSLLLANSANYATAQTEYYSWYQNSVIPWAEFMAEIMTEQLFEPLGLRFEFRPEQAAPDQEQEVQRAGAYQTYVGAGIKPSWSAQIVGIDLPPGVEYEDLDPEEEPEPEPQPVPPQLVDQAQEQPEQMQDAEPDEDDDEEEQPAKFVPTFEQFNELHAWRATALRRHNKALSMPVDYVVSSVPQVVSGRIRERLKSASDDATIKSAFEFDGLPAESELDKLVASINRLAETRK